MKKERIFEHSRFNSTINASWIASDIVKNMERGSASAEKIVTVLNEIHKTEGISSLNRISNETIKNYEIYLKTAYDKKELVAHSVQGYAAAMNAISNYINLRTDKNLPQISVYKDLNIKNVIQYGGKSTPQELYNKVYTKLSESNQIKQDLQRNLGLRMKESHYIKAATIKNALETGVLKLNQSNNDGTKNSKFRELKIWTDAQKNTLIRALNYMSIHNQLSMIENGKTFLKAQSKYYRDMRKAGGTRTANGGNNFGHGSRHFNIIYKSNIILPNAGIKDNKAIDSIVSTEAGHSETRTTDIYRGKH